MSSYRLLGPEEKVFVTYKNSLPARVIAVEKRGRKHYLLIRWDNFGSDQFKPEKWVKDTLCKEYETPNKEALLQTRVKLAWWQKMIVKLQNWWYGNN
jgi:hypothetical protein